MVQSANGTGRSGPAAYGDPQPARQEDLSWPVYSGDGRLEPPLRPAEPGAAADGRDSGGVTIVGTDSGGGGGFAARR